MGVATSCLLGRAKQLSGESRAQEARLEEKSNDFLFPSSQQGL